MYKKLLALLRYSLNALAVSALCVAFLELFFSIAKTGEQEVIEIDNSIGYAPIPNKSVTWRKEGFGIHYFNKDRLPNCKYSPRQNLSDTRVAVLGDSLVLSLEVPPKDNFVNHTETILNKSGKYEFINFGVSNYNLGQMLIQYRNSVRRFRPNVVILSIRPDSFANLIPPEKVSSLFEARPYFRLTSEHQAGKPSLEMDLSYMKIWLNSMDAQRMQSLNFLRRTSRIYGTVSGLVESFASALHSSSREPDGSAIASRKEQLEKSWKDRANANFPIPQRLQDLAITLILTLNNECKKDNAKLVILRIATKDGYTNPEENEILERLTSENKIDYIDVTTDFRQALISDSGATLFYCTHFNKEGHSLVSKHLVNYFKNQQHDRPSQ